MSLDATVIDLCAAVFDWAQFRTTKGAVKLHLLLDHDGYLPSYAVITEGKVHEIQVARQLKLQRGTVLVLDRGYSDYAWFQHLTEEDVHFVTRLKDNATYLVVERRPRSGEGVLADEIIVLEKQADSGSDALEISGALIAERARAAPRQDSCNVSSMTVIVVSVVSDKGLVVSKGRGQVAVGCDAAIDQRNPDTRASETSTPGGGRVHCSCCIIEHSMQRTIRRNIDYVGIVSQVAQRVDRYRVGARFHNG